MERRIEHGHIWISTRGGWSWWVIKQLPWWDPVRENPRYIAIEKTLDKKRPGNANWWGDPGAVRCQFIKRHVMSLNMIATQIPCHTQGNVRAAILAALLISR